MSTSDSPLQRTLRSQQPLAALVCGVVGVVASIQQVMSSGPRGLYLILGAAGIVILLWGAGIGRARRQRWEELVAYTAAVLGTVVLTVAVLGGFQVIDIRPPHDTATSSQNQVSPTPPPATPSTSPTPTPTRTTATGTVTISSPAEGSKVGGCAVLKGTSDLPSSKTLVFAVKNTFPGQPEYFAEPVWHWEDQTATKPLGAWYVQLYFGADQPRQKYVVDVLKADLDTVSKVQSKLKNADDPNWHFKTYPAGLEKIASLNVIRKAGAGDCPT